MKISCGRSLSRWTPGTSKPVRRSFRHLGALHQEKARGLEIHRQRAANGRKTIEGRADGIGDAGGDFRILRHAGDFGHCLDLFWIGSCNAALARLSFSFAAARLSPE